CDESRTGRSRLIAAIIVASSLEWKAGHQGSEESLEPTENVDAEDDTSADQVVDETSLTADDVIEDPLETFKAELRAQFGEWYVIHSYAGYENRVKANLESRKVSLNMEDYIHQVEVRMEEEVAIRRGQRKV